MLSETYRLTLRIKQLEAENQSLRQQLEAAKYHEPQKGIFSRCLSLLFNQIENRKSKTDNPIVHLTHDRRAEKTTVRIEGQPGIVFDANSFLKFESLFVLLGYHIDFRNEQADTKTIILKP